MILFTILLLITLMLIAILIFAASIGGVIGIIICGDLIVCIYLIVKCMTKIWKRKF